MSDFVSAQRIKSLKTGIETKTGETYSDLTGAVQALADGYNDASALDEQLAGMIGVLDGVVTGGGGYKTATGTVILEADAEYVKVTGIGFTPVAFALCCTKVIADSACGGVFVRGTGTLWRTGTGNTTVGTVGYSTVFTDYSIQSDDATPGYGTSGFGASCIVTETGFGIGTYNNNRPYRAGAEFEWWAIGE